MAILKADPAYRRRALLLYLACVAIGLGLILWGLPLLGRHIDEYAKAGDLAGGIRVLKILVALLFVPTFPMTYSLYRFARRVQTSGQLPPPGAKVLRDTVIVEGATARRRGNQRP